MKNKFEKIDMMKRSTGSEANRLNIPKFEHSAESSTRKLMHQNEDCILIVDTGSKYLKLIDEKIRAQDVDTLVLSLNSSIDAFLDSRVKGVILSGGKDPISRRILKLSLNALCERGIPILAIDSGFQMICNHFGGTISVSNKSVDGLHEIAVQSQSILFEDTERTQTVYMTNIDNCTELPEGFQTDAISQSNSICGMSNDSKKIYAIQFHPETKLTIHGETILSNFLFKICNCKKDLSLEMRMLRAIDKIKSTLTEGDNVMVLVSGGLDSTVCVSLLTKAIPLDHIVPIFIDNGFMRSDDIESAVSAMESLDLKVNVGKFQMDFLHANSQLYDDSMGAFQTVDPLNQVISQKCKQQIIEDTFIKVSKFMMEERKLSPEHTYFVRSTLRSDLLECKMWDSKDNSGTKNHDSAFMNEIRKQGRLLEPLNDFHKNEIRMLGRKLKLENSILKRHPFPATGFANRIICSGSYFNINLPDDEHKLLINLLDPNNTTPDQILPEIQKVVSPSDVSLLHKITSNLTISATVLSLRTEGIQEEDTQCHKHSVVLSSKNLPDWKELASLAGLITKSCGTINRVLYAFGEAIDQNLLFDLTPTRLNPMIIQLVREIDDFVISAFKESGHIDSVSLFPVILIPVHFDRPDPAVDPSAKRSIVLRPLKTDDYATYSPAIPNESFPELFITNLVSEIMKKFPSISRVLLDITSQPPAFVEWE